MAQIISMFCRCIRNVCCCKKHIKLISDQDETENQSTLLLQTLRRRINAFDIDFTSNHNENITVMWLDNQIDIDTENTNQMKTLLEQINESILMFSSKEAFFECLETMTNQTIFLVSSGQFAIDILPLINTHQRVHSSYIFCIQERRYEYLSNHCSKLRGIFSDPKGLIFQIKKDIHFYMEHLIKFNSFNKNKQKSIIDLSQQSAEFLWCYLLKDILTNINRTEYARQIMIDYCRLEYQGNSIMLQQIDEFEQNYKSEDAIEWYTKDSFLYRILNKSIRTENMHALMKLTFFITDLSTHLKTKWQNDYGQQQYDPIKVYRGAQLTDDEISKLHDGVLISLNGYLSTSSSLETACVYANNVIFEIEINSSMEYLVFASIAEYSQFPQEEEILIDLGSMFQITCANYDSNNNRFIIKMIGVNEGDRLANEYIKTIKDTMKTRGYLDGLASDFIHKLGFQRGLRLYEILLRMSTEDVNRILNNCSRFFKLYENCSDASNVAILFGCFGWFFLQRAEYDLAIKCCTRVLSSMEKTSSNDRIDIEIANCHNTIGWAYCQKGNYDLALDWCLKAAKMLENCTYIEYSKYVKVLRSEEKLEKCPIRNDVEYAEVLANLGYIYYKQNNVNLSMSYCTKSMNILAIYDNKITRSDQDASVASNYEPDNHYETIAANYEVFGNIDYENGNYVLALEYYKKALEIFEDRVLRIPICIQRSPHIFGRDKQRLQNLITAIQKQINDE